MAVVAKKVNYNDYKDAPTSKLCKQEYITKPEARQLGTKVGMKQAISYVAKLGDGK